MAKIRFGVKSGIIPFEKGGLRGICPNESISKSPLTPLFQKGGISTLKKIDSLIREKGPCSRHPGLGLRLLRSPTTNSSTTECGRSLRRDRRGRLFHHDVRRAPRPLRPRRGRPGRKRSMRRARSRARRSFDAICRCVLGPTRVRRISQPRSVDIREEAAMVACDWRNRDREDPLLEPGSSSRPARRQHRPRRRRRRRLGRQRYRPGRADWRGARRRRERDRHRVLCELCDPGRERRCRLLGRRRVRSSDTARRGQRLSGDGERTRTRLPPPLRGAGRDREGLLLGLRPSRPDDAARLFAGRCGRHGYDRGGQ